MRRHAPKREELQCDAPSRYSPSSHWRLPSRWPSRRAAQAGSDKATAEPGPRAPRSPPTRSSRTARPRWRRRRAPRSRPTWRSRSQGDTSKMTDPTAKAMLGQGLSVHVEGKSSPSPHGRRHDHEPGHRRPDAGIRHDGRGRQGLGPVPGQVVRGRQKTSKGLGEQASTARRPPSSSRAWASTRRTWGRVRATSATEDLDGVQVYHVKADGGPAEAGRRPCEGRRGPKPAAEARRQHRRARAAQLRA